MARQTHSRQPRIHLRAVRYYIQKTTQGIKFDRRLALLAASALLALCSVFLLVVDVRAGSTLRILESEEQGRCDRGKEEKPLSYVFLHLHKTAGNNLKEALFGFAKRNSLHLYHTCHPSEGDDILSAWWFQRRKKANVDYDCNLFSFAKLPYHKRNSFDLVVGHQYLGVHDVMPARDVRYFTFMREPLARKVSHFQHFETKPVRGKERRVADGLDVRLWTYLTSRNRNYMTKRLSTGRVSSEILTDVRSRLIDSSPAFGRVALASAQANLLNRFFFVGLQDRFAESLCILTNLLNTACYSGNRGINENGGKRLNPGKISRRRVNFRGRAKRGVRALPPAVKEAALSAEALDVELYALATKLFEQHLSKHPECRFVDR